MNKIKYLIVFILFLDSCKTIKVIETNEMFEGVITYKAKSYKYDNDGTSHLYDKSIETLYFKNNNSLEVKEGAQPQRTLYLSDSNKTYMTLGKFDTLVVAEKELDTVKYGNWVYYEKKTRILGKECDLYYDAGNSQWLYCNSSMNPEAYSKHPNKPHWPYLKFVLEAHALHTKHRFEHVAVKMERKKLDDKIFEIPNLPQKNLKKYFEEQGVK